jgi:hypothetical protein
MIKYIEKKIKCNLLHDGNQSTVEDSHDIKYIASYNTYRADL